MKDGIEITGQGPVDVTEDRLVPESQARVEKDAPNTQAPEPTWPAGQEPQGSLDPEPKAEGGEG